MQSTPATVDSSTVTSHTLCLQDSWHSENPTCDNYEHCETHRDMLTSSNCT